MKLGSGFNSYTQQLCIDHAVGQDDAAPKYAYNIVKAEGIAQSVTYKTEVISKMSDITDALDISGALTIKYNNLVDGSGKGSFINSNKIKESDMSFITTVKVVNQVIIDHSLTKFNQITGLKPSSFTDVYGDCFISGYQEGGEFHAIISIKVKDKTQLDEIAANAAVALTTPAFTKKEDKKPKHEESPRDAKDTKDTTQNLTAEEGATDPKTKIKDNDEKGLILKGDAEMKKNRRDVFTENETTISVSWTGGGQNLKAAGDDWDFETLREAAIKFADLVANTPMRTHVVLTKYTALKSFHVAGAQFSPLTYENAGIYTTTLQDAFLDYKSIAKDISLLAMDVDGGRKTLTVSEAKLAGGTTPQAFETINKSSVSDSLDAIDTPETGSATSDNKTEGSSQLTKSPHPLIIQKPYDATLAGLEGAKIHCRFMMNRIVNEVDLVTKNPLIAQQEERVPPFMSPMLFKQLLPIGKVATSTAVVV
ncbi:hypothetical protein MMC28_008019 [Mycoblastus sanguinarius]|nr:hypothetical protein [Mycoblastus sanguinarius]